MITLNESLRSNGRHPSAQNMQTSLQLLPLIMNNMPQAVFWKDRNLVFLGCNTVFANDAGVSSPNEIIGKTDFDMPWKEHAELYRVDDRLVMESGEAKLNYEEPHTANDGSRTWVRVSKIPVQVDGEIVAVLGMYEDITEHKNAEKALANSEAQFRSLFEQSADAILLIENGIFIDCNQATVQMMRAADKEEFLSLHPSKLSPEYQPDGRLSSEKADDMMRIALEKGSNRFEWIHHRVDGSDFPVEVLLTTITAGDRQIIHTVWRDITERKKAEQAMNQLLAQHNAVLENALVGIAHLVDRKFVWMNPRMAEMFGYQPEEVAGVDTSAFYPSTQDFEQLGRDAYPLLSQGKTYATERLMKRKDGALFWCALAGKSTPGQASESIWILQDITERKKAEETIKDERQRFQTILETIRVPTLISRLADGQVLYANEALAQVSQIDLNKLMGFKTGNFYVNADERKTVLESLKQHGHINDFEVQFRRTDGSLYWALSSSRVINYEGESCVLSTYIDITNRKYAENLLQQSQANLASALHVAQMGYWEFDIPTQMFTFNDQYYSLHGTTAQEVGGYQMSVQRFAQEFVYPEDAPTVGMATQQAIETTDPNFNVQIESRILRKSGEIRWVTVWFRIEKDPEGRTIKLHGVNQDITERKRLEQQVQTAFERRGLQVQLSTQVSQSIAVVSSLEELYERVVSQVKEQFGYYHTQILRYDAAQEAVVLVTGYGEIGAKMLAAGHRLPMGQGLIGTAATTGDTVLRSTLENDPDWHPNPLLPETKGEIAVPIKLGNSILGVLDVQSNLAGSLDADDQLLLEGLCGQIATAMESTRLRQEMAEQLEETNRLYRAMSHEGWQTYQERTDIPSSFVFDQSGLRPAEDASLADELFARLPLTVPGGEVIGTLAIANDPQRPISPDDQAFLEQVSEQVALALESARLFEQTQEALVQTEELSRQNELILDTAGEGIFGLDENGNHTFVNPAAAAMLGYSTEELLGRHSHSIWHHSYANGSHYPAEECPIYASLHDGKINQGEEYFWRKDGIGFFVDFTSTPVKQGDRTIGAVVTFRDITERKKAQEALQTSRAQLSEALEIARLANWEYDFERDRFIFNDNFYSIFHTTVEQVGSYEVSAAEYSQRFVHPDDAALVGGEIGKAIASTGRHYSTKLEHRILFADGGMGYIAVDVHIERDENGKITRWYGANQDITERKKAELVVQESEARLSEALNIAKLANWEYDVERDRFIFNDHFYAIFHTTVEQIGGYEVSSAEYAQRFVHPDDVPMVGEEIGKALSSTDRHYNVQLEHRILYADGGMGYISVNVHIERDENGKITRYYGANQDITERKMAELAIQQSEVRLSEALNIAKLANWEYDVEKDIFTFNDHFYSIFHTTVEQVGGYQLSPAQYVQMFIYPEDAAAVGQEIGRGLTSTERHFSASLEHRILFADGGIGYMSVEVHVEHDENGKITRCYGANQDITERKLAEEAIKKEQERTRAILESVTVPMVITRLSDNELTFVNTPAMEVTQFKYEEVINQPAPDFYARPDDRKNFIAELRAKGRVSDMVVQLRRKNGGTFWALLSAIVFDYQNEASILTTFMDITDRIRAEESIAKRAAELQTVAEVSTTTASTLEPDRLLQAVVDLTKEQFGLYHAHIYLADEAWQTLLLAAGAGEVGRTMVAEGWNIPLDHESSIVATAARTRKHIIANDVVHDKESTFLSNRLLPDTRSEMAVPIIVGEKLLGVFDVQSDVIERFTDADANIYITLASQVGVALQNARSYVEQAATLNQLRELDKLKSSFLANMSHELRTPLNSILGFTDVIMEGLDGPLTEYMDNDLRLIQKNGQHLLHLINDVLDMAKIEAGRMNLNPETFKVHEVLHEVTSITSTLANEKNLSLRIEEDSDQDIEIYADRTRLRQVMINLVNNAIKFTESGKVTINASPMEGARVLITVKDMGIGIPPEKLEAVFQEFTQVDSSSTRKAGGTGLGLPISRRLVAMHGGRLWAESTGIAGEGSTFYVEMPLEARIVEVVEKQEK